MIGRAGFGAWGVMALLAAAGSAGGADVFRVGPIAAPRGARASGMLDVPAAADGATSVPLSVLHGGRGAGPVVALIAGNHGYEYAPILALQRLLHQIDPQQLSGTVLMVHVANLPSFLGRTIYTSPVDRKNLNRVYPGRPDGTLSERIAHLITTEVIERADVVLDLHCGDGNESLRPYSYWDGEGDPELVRRSKELALAFGLDHIVVDRGRPRDPAASVYCSTTALTRGKPSITTESGALGQSDPDSIARIERGVLSVLRHLGMLPGAPDRVDHPIFLERSEVLRSSVAGIFYPLVERGQSVAQGTLLGYVTDFFGARILELRSPFAGEVLYVIATPPISEGEPLAMIGATVR